MKLDLNQPWTGFVAPAVVAPNPEQPRKFFSVVELERLARSLEKRQEVACTVMPWPTGQPKPAPGVEWMLIDGERRWRAAMQAELPQLWIAYKPGVTVENIHGASLTANFNRAGHTKMETARALQRELDAGRSVVEVARSVGKTDTWVRNYLMLLELHPDLQKLLDEPTPKEQRLPMAVGVQLAVHDVTRQVKLWLKVRSMRNTEAMHAVRVAYSGSTGRTPARDARYVLGKLQYAAAGIEAVNNLGAVMLRKVTSARTQEMQSAVVQIRMGLDRFEESINTQTEES